MSRTAVGVIVLAVGCGLIAASEPAPTQWALVIGIDDYLYFDDRDGGDLRGAEADAARMADAFRTAFDVPAGNIITLLGAAATRDSIESILTRWLPAHVGPSDRVLIYYSGHGAQVLDVDGDEADGLDETICPVDVLPDSPARDIRDDELRRWLAALTAPEKVVILDSCHSGTATRAGITYARSRRLVRGSLSPAPRTASAGISGGGIDLEGVSGVVELSAAAAGQMALEVEVSPNEGLVGRYGGVFTTKLLRKIRALPRNATIQDLYWATFHAVKADGFVQDPQLSGQAQKQRIRENAGLAGPTSPTLAARYRVLNAEQDPAVVRWNTPGPAIGTLLLSSNGDALEVLSTDSAGIRGRVLAGRLRTGQELAAVGMRLDLPEIVIEVGDHDVRGPIVTALSRTPGARVRLGQGVDATFTLVASSSGDSVLILGPDRTPRLGLPLSGRPEDLEAIRRWMAVERGRSLVARLANPAEPFGLMLRAEAMVFRVNDPIELRVYSEVSGYLTLLDVAPDGSLTVLVPNAGSRRVEIQADAELELPGPGMDLTFRAAPPPGRGTVVAIVTGAPLEFEYGPSGFASLDRGEQFLQVLAQAVPLHDPPPELAGGGRAFVNLDDWNSTLMTYEIGAVQRRSR